MANSLAEYMVDKPNPSNSLAEYMTDGTSPSLIPTKPRQNFFGAVGEIGGNLLRGITEPAVKTIGVWPQQGIEALATGLGSMSAGQGFKPTATPRRLPFYGEIKPAGSVREAVGETGKTLALGVGQPELIPLAGGMWGASEALEKGAGPWGILGGEVTGAVGAKALQFAGNAVIDVVTGKASPKLLDQAVEQYKRALGATTKGEKALAGKVAPELAERKIFGVSRGSLQRQAEAGLETSGQALESAYANLPEERRVYIKPIFDAIEKRKSEMLIDGILPTEKQSEVVFLDKAKENLMKFVEPNPVAEAALKAKQITKSEYEGTMKISPQSIREYRQVLDKTLAASRRGFKMTGKGGPKLDAQNAMANSIRRELAKQFPDIGKVNNEFTFWKNFSDLMETTVNKGKKPDLSLIAGAADIAHPGVGVMVKLGDFISNNTAWNTFSAAQKSRLADLLSEGNYNAARSLIGTVMLNMGKSLIPKTK